MLLLLFCCPGLQDVHDLHACALSRVLREDSRHSVDLSSDILRAFLALSSFSHLHGHLKALRVLGTALTILESMVQEHIRTVRFALSVLVCRTYCDSCRIPYILCL